MNLLTRLLVAVFLAGALLPVGGNTAQATDTFSDIANSPYKADIEWLVSAGVTLGCGNGKFCPAGQVNREQMASFLVRFFRLPATTHDYFTDDSTSTHQSNINALAASGITLGCGATTFCPKALVNREQMAAFLTRGLKLKFGGANNFHTDDNDSAFQADIDRMYAANVASSCSSGKFCPKTIMTRELMANWLHRADPIRIASAGKTNEVIGATKVTFNVGRYTGYKFNADFTAVASQFTATNLAAATVNASSRSIINGQQYYLVSSGSWANYWLPTFGSLALRDGQPLPGCGYGNVLTKYRAYGDWASTLMDLYYMVPSTYKPTDLVAVTTAGARYGTYGVPYVRNIMTTDLTALVTAVRNAGYGQLKINTAFRDYALQSSWWGNYVRGGGTKTYPTTLPPGHSEHQLGTTLDMDVYAASGLNAWMNANGYKYGFVKSYPPGKNVNHCIGSEDWHYRYVGRTIAARIVGSGLTVREYQWFTAHN